MGITNFDIIYCAAHDFKTCAASEQSLAQMW